ncbi:MAG: hypothetical protein C1O27_001258 [Chloroflexi bacterium]|jgi:hypothetical protein|nr:MAG: hypothetical protein C1O27_001258 [Chloroflexota bacterium]
MGLIPTKLRRFGPLGTRASRRGIGGKEFHLPGSADAEPLGRWRHFLRLKAPLKTSGS